jgi:hypothetical protein
MEILANSFDTLYKAAATYDTITLGQLLGDNSGNPSKIWVNIRNSDNMTVAGKLAMEGFVDAAIRLCAEWHAFWEDVVEGLIVGSLKHPELIQIARDLHKKYTMHPVVLARAYARINQCETAIAIYKSYFKDQKKHPKSQENFLYEIGLGLALGSHWDQLWTLNDQIYLNSLQFSMQSMEFTLLHDFDLARTVGRRGDKGLIDIFLGLAIPNSLSNTDTCSMLVCCIEGLVANGHYDTLIYHKLKTMIEGLDPLFNDISGSILSGYADSANLDSFKKMLAQQSVAYQNYYKTTFYQKLTIKGYYEVAQDVLDNVTIENFFINQLFGNGHVTYLSSDIFSSLLQSKNVNYHTDSENQGYYWKAEYSGYSHFWHIQLAKDFISRISKAEVRAYYLAISGKAFGKEIKEDIAKYAGEIDVIKKRYSLESCEAAIVFQKYSLLLVAASDGTISFSPEKSVPIELTHLILQHLESPPIHPLILNELCKAIEKRKESTLLSKGSFFKLVQQEVNTIPASSPETYPTTR